MHIVIMGCGRVGAMLAKGLEKRGHSVAVIDVNVDAFRRLGNDFHGTTVKGVGFDRQVLEEAGIRRADAFAAVSSGDNSNILAARVVREIYHIENVVARIYDQGRAAVYERLGIPTVATVPWTTDRLLNVLTRETETTKWRDPSGNVGVTELPLHEEWAGHRVTALEQATGGRVAFLIRFGSGLLPDAKTVIQAGDQVYLAAVSGHVAEAMAISALAPSPDVDDE